MSAVKLKQSLHPHHKSGDLYNGLPDSIPDKMWTD
jgi:hypothetical protein